MATPCPRCKRPVIRCRLDDESVRILDAEPTPDGVMGVWSQTVGLNVVMHARVATVENHLGEGGLHRLHDCAPAGQQLEFAS